MRLYLMQHGDAVSKDVDPDRPLSDKGRRDAERLGDFLSRTPFKTDRVLHSGKNRAQQTAEIISARASPDAKIEAADGMGPKDGVKSIAKKAGQWTEDILLVGHLPFMGRLVSHLIKNDADAEVVAFKPGSIVCCERDADDHWRIAWMLRPELLA